MMNKTPKQIFLDEVDRLFKIYEVDPTARGVLHIMRNDKLKTSKKKPASDSTKNSILEVLRSSDCALNREQIAAAIEGELSPNSISAYASQLVNDGLVKKSAQRYAKGRTQMVYSIA